MSSETTATSAQPDGDVNYVVLTGTIDRRPSNPHGSDDRLLYFELRTKFRAPSSLVGTFELATEVPVYVYGPTELLQSVAKLEAGARVRIEAYLYCEVVLDACADNEYFNSRLIAQQVSMVP